MQAKSMQTNSLCQEEQDYSSRECGIRILNDECWLVFASWCTNDFLLLAEQPILSLQAEPPYATLGVAEAVRMLK